MSKKSVTMKTIIAIFEHEYHEVLARMEALHEAVNNLQYEGKALLGKNTKSITRSMKFLKDKMSHHIDLDEKVIFPYVSMHIPKLDPMLYFLRAERNEFKLSLANFEVLFKKMQEEKNILRQQKIIDQLKEKGMYVICLMRNHIQIEIESVYKPMDRQLHQDEKKELIKKCLVYNLNPKSFAHSVLV